MSGSLSVSKPRVQRKRLQSGRLLPAAMLWFAAEICGLLAFRGATAQAGLRFERQADRLAIKTDAGEPVADYVFDDSRIGRPSLRDLHTPAGCVVTRPCPPRPGFDPPDHPTMHPGAMLCFSDLSGHDPWRHKTAVRFVGFVEAPATREGRVSFTAVSEYLATANDTPDAAVLCREESTISIDDRDVAGARVRVIRWTAGLTAGPTGVTFADVQEMGFGIRLLKELAPKWGGRYLASHGGRNEAGVFGRQAEWCDASGTVDGRPCGVLCVDGGGNPRQPFFHARDSGWLLMNHFGCQTYTGGNSGAVVVEPGETLRLSAVVVLHDGVPQETLSDLAASVERETAATSGPAESDGSAPGPGRLVPPTVIEGHVSVFNRQDPEDVVGAVPNAAAAEWLEAHAPRFDCPDREFVELWYFRWWAFRKHLRRDAAGRWVFTEFITRPEPVSSALGHHLMEGRWLRDPQFLDAYVDHWLAPEQQARLHKYSQWLPHALWQRAWVTGDTAFVTQRLDALLADHARWGEERRHGDGLFWQYDVRDAMEESISGSRTAKNVRPTLNSYMAASSLALAEIAQAAGRNDEAIAFATDGTRLRDRMTATLWNPADQFFEVVREDGSFAGVREAIGFIPWYFSLVPAGQGYEEAWRQLTDEKGFRAAFGITTAERRHPDFRSHGVGTCEWDGAVWPFATSQTLTALANVLRTGGDLPVTVRDYFDALITYARSQRWDGKPYIGEYLDETTGAWLKGPDPRSRWYNHSTFADLVITGLVGLVPRADDTLEIHPLLPADTWEWFCLEGIRYRGHDLTILWDHDGSRYGRGQGLSVWADGRRLIASPTLEPVTGSLTVP
jgi:hypothetical protein